MGPPGYLSKLLQSSLIIFFHSCSKGLWFMWPSSNCQIGMCWICLRLFQFIHTVSQFLGQCCVTCVAQIHLRPLVPWISVTPPWCHHQIAHHPHRYSEATHLHCQEFFWFLKRSTEGYCAWEGTKHYSWKMVFNNVPFFQSDIPQQTKVISIWTDFNLQQGLPYIPCNTDSPHSVSEGGTNFQTVNQWWWLWVSLCRAIRHCYHLCRLCLICNHCLMWDVLNRFPWGYLGFSSKIPSSNCCSKVGYSSSFCMLSSFPVVLPGLLNVRFLFDVIIKPNIVNSAHRSISEFVPRTIGLVVIPYIICSTQDYMQC